MSDQSFDNLLALDSSTSRLVLAVSFGGDRTVKSDNRVEKTHGQIIIKKIDELLESSDLPVGDLDGLVVCVGPGSFTGLRIGLAAFKGLAVANKLPLIGLDLFELAAHKLSWEQAPVHLLIPSRKGEFYFGTVEDGVVVPEKTGIVAQDKLTEQVGNRRVYGIDVNPTEILPGLSARQEGGQLAYDGGDLIVMGRERLLAGQKADLAGLEPLYLQKSMAETNFERLNQS
ncbi:MAG: tRNA (adenosine(37)-N6)-threonylcarbamoyltransferase complex dimerization subunit type 1 TsaB [bacterium]|nr:tRNA (adenosine(37)-N6)-threonylcarbamoyltransferase complex dimerization subunit type 1 TsaB [bacterium]